MTPSEHPQILLPRDAAAAVEIVRILRDGGHAALLAGGCVRDLLLGLAPKDYDVATDAPPERIRSLFAKTRLVGAQFGVVLVSKRRRWIEVATFRTDGSYLDGRRPSTVVFTNAEHDAQRRDFTINGMFLDPLSLEVLDYVGGRADLLARRVRAIGEPGQRFAEDYLRIIRAVRFAARLGFEIEAHTFHAVQQHAPMLANVAAERVRDELERMLSQPSRASAFAWLRKCGLLPHLWRDACWGPAQIAAAQRRLELLTAEAPFVLALAAMLADRGDAEVQVICRSLACSNEQREAVAWLIEHQADLDQPDRSPLAALKRLMAHAAFDLLRAFAESRYRALPGGEARRQTLDARIAAIAPEAVAPAPWVGGEDLLARGLEPGPVFRELLNELYTRQLDEQLTSRKQALAALDELIRQRSIGPRE